MILLRFVVVAEGGTVFCCVGFEGPTVSSSEMFRGDVVLEMEMKMERDPGGVPSAAALSSFLEKAFLVDGEVLVSCLT